LVELDASSSSILLQRRLRVGQEPQVVHAGPRGAGERPLVGADRLRREHAHPGAEQVAVCRGLLLVQPGWGGASMSWAPQLLVQLADLENPA
jgi:hypothetical protein